MAMLRTTVLLLLCPILCLVVLPSPSSCEIALQGIQTHEFDLLSYEGDASCSDHQPYLCGAESKSPSKLYKQVNEENCNNNLPSCPSKSEFNSSCFPNHYVPPKVTYQFVHTVKGSTNYTYRFSWETLPEHCHVQYYQFIFTQRTPETSDDSCSGYAGKHQCFPYNLTNETTEIDIFFDRFIKPSADDDINLTRYFKLIAYPVYEWPTVSFELPGHCTEEVDLTALNPTGCSTCNGGCEVDDTPPQNFQVTYFPSSDGVTMSANISWTPSSADTTKHYLHVNSSDTKRLYWLDKDVSELTVTGIDPLEMSEVWLERFSCGCSGETEKFRFPLSGSGDDGAQPDYDSSSQSSHSTHSSTTTFQSSYTTSILPSSITSSPSSPSISTHYTSSYMMSSPDPSPSPQVNKKPPNNHAVIYIASSISVLFVFVVTVAVVVVFILFVIMKRRGCCFGLCPRYKSKPQGEQLYPMDNRSHRNTGLPTRVMLIHSTETKEKKLLEILTFLEQDLGSLEEEDGKKLFSICRYDTATERDHPSEWLDKNYKSCDYIICIMGKKFKREWNNEIRPNMPLVFAFHQLFNASFTTASSNPLDKLVIVLRSKSKDEKHIPSQYLRGKKIFEMDDIQGLASYMLGRPRHVFSNEHAV